jgi:hypothetical protein
MSIQVDGNPTSGVSYDLRNGRLFFISSHHDAPKVTQLKRDALEAVVGESAKEYIEVRLKELAVNDAEIKQFLTKGASGREPDSASL